MVGADFAKRMVMFKNSAQWSDGLSGSSIVFRQLEEIEEVKLECYKSVATNPLYSEGLCGIHLSSVTRLGHRETAEVSHS